MISANNYSKGQAPVQRIEAKKTNIYGDWDSNIYANVSISPQNVMLCVDKRNSIKIGDLPYYGRYDPKDEITFKMKRKRTTQRYHIEFDSYRDSDIFVETLHSLVFTKWDIIELDRAFDIHAYSGETIMVVKHPGSTDLSALSDTFEYYKKCNNVFLILTISYHLNLRHYVRISYENRFDFFDELRTPKASFEEV
jgi:hypothetical protein